MSNFHVGQKVVCIEDSGTALLEKGKVYTVTWFTTWPGVSAMDGNIVRGGVRLAEVEAEGDGFDARRFRPAVDRKTDISIFKAMLHTQRTRVSA